MITVAVHTKSGIKLHVIGEKKESPNMKIESGAPLLSSKIRRWLTFILLTGMAATMIAQAAGAQTLPTMQQIHDQLAVMKKQGVECEYNERAAWTAVVVALEDIANADDPLRHHPAWEADMQVAVLQKCGLLPGVTPPPPPPPTPHCTGLNW